MTVKTYSLDLPFARDPGANYDCAICNGEASHWSQAEAADGETPLGPVVYHCQEHTEDATSLAWLLATPEQDTDYWSFASHPEPGPVSNK